MELPSRNKLKGDGLKLWDMLIADFGDLVKPRHKPLLFAMCQQWELYQEAHRKVEENQDPQREWTLHCQMSGSLKHFKSISKEFAMGIEDELPSDETGFAIPQSRLAKLLDSNN